ERHLTISITVRPRLTQRDPTPRAARALQQEWPRRADAAFGQRLGSTLLRRLHGGNARCGCYRGRRKRGRRRLALEPRPSTRDEAEAAERAEPVRVERQSTPAGPAPGCRQ